MSDVTFQDTPTHPPDLATIAEEIRAIALSRKEDSRALLELLRLLEAVHREIEQTWFQPALPQSRHELYDLLRDIETEGGWPYIYSRHVRTLLNQLVAASIKPPSIVEAQPELESEQDTPNSH
jgi:hypothetical protein